MPSATSPTDPPGPTRKHRFRSFPMKNCMPMIPKTKNIQMISTRTSSISGTDSMRVLTSSRMPGIPLIVRNGRMARKARSPDMFPAPPGKRKL